MKTYLKNLFIAISIVVIATVPAQAQNAASVPAAPVTAAPAAPAAAPATASSTSNAAHVDTAPTISGAAAPASIPAASAKKAQDVPIAPASALAPAQPYYNYAHDESEYSVMLPEAPEVKTIWKESPETTPYLDNPPNDSAALGEIATFKRIDIDTEEVFDVKITFLKARKSFLQDLTEEKIKDMLTKQLKNQGQTLADAKFTFSQGTSTLKWATLGGFSLDEHHRPSFSAIHYLTGLQSILVVQVTYSVENKIFGEYYNTLVNSISYCAL